MRLHEDYADALGITIEEAMDELNDHAGLASTPLVIEPMCSGCDREQFDCDCEWLNS